MERSPESAPEPPKIALEQYQAADPFRVTCSALKIDQELLFLKKRTDGGVEHIENELIHIDDLQDIEDGKKLVSFTRITRGDEHPSQPDKLTLSYRSYVEELPEGPEKIRDWQDYPNTPRPLGFLISPDFFKNKVT